MNSTIAALLLQDGLTNGLLYALIALSILIVFLVTRVFWIPAGEMVVFGSLTMGLLNTGMLPGTVWLLAILAVVALLSYSWSCWRQDEWRHWWRVLAFCALYPSLTGVLAAWMAPLKPDPGWRAVLTLLLVTPMAPLLYLAVFRPIADATILTKLIVAVALHTVLIGLGLLLFGAEGLRSPALVSGRIDAGFMRISWQLVLVLIASVVLMLALWLFFENTLWGKALRATAVNRLGARLVAVRLELSGLLAFGIAGFIGALTGVLIAPISTMYYDGGFLIALKAFIGVVCAGMVSFPAAVAGALLVGVLDAFAAFYASSIRDVIVFAALIPILIWRSLSSHHSEFEE